MLRAGAAEQQLGDAWAIQPSDLMICQRMNGDDWMLGAGSYGISQCPHKYILTLTALVSSSKLACTNHRLENITSYILVDAQALLYQSPRDPTWVMYDKVYPFGRLMSD